ncbi:MAG: hypothetical protein LAT51_03270 [Flavobacteriaceae bacterium]|nr:hypothetical protein [Flavobacteriaceae bacterium]
MKNLSDAEERKMKEVKQLAIILMEKHKVSHYSFRFGYGWRYLGRCTSIAIILNYKHALFGDMEDIKNTLLHEIAHPIVGLENGHCEVWQLKAKELGVVYNRNFHK